MTEPIEPRLVFIASQPRSGSTMLQKILAAHSQVASCSEPWLMLPPLGALAQQRLDSGGQNTELSRQAMGSFLQDLPGGRARVIRAVREAYGALYADWMAGRPESRFVDKTPRYYQVLPELLEVFPSARFILLLRHPLAVLASHLTTWAQPIDAGLFGHRDDLLLAPGMLADYLERFRDRLVVARYEDILADPGEQIKRLCGELDLEYEAGMLDYGESNNEQWMFGDQSNVHAEGKVQPENVDAWRQQLVKPPVWRLSREYADFLGERLFEQLGYPPDETGKLLASTRPNAARLKLCFSMQTIMDAPRRDAPRQAVINHFKRKYVRRF